ncbi:MAG: hypothetical protein ACOC3I_03035 [Verrucomicrobiota bacterium]
MIYTFFAGYGWYDGLFRPVDPATLLQPGAGYVLRLPKTASPVYWASQGTPAYLQ